MAVAVLIGVIYDKGKGFKQNFSLEVTLFLLASVFAMFGAKWGHGQDLLLSAWAQSVMYFYFFYFFIHLVRIRPGDFERLLIIMGGLYAFLFFAQTAVFPLRIINVGTFEGRGTIRIFMPGMMFAELAFYYFLLVLVRTNNLKYAVFCMVYLIIVILQGTRQILLVTSFGILAVIFISKQVKSRMLMVFLIFIGSVLIFFIFQDIFMQLIEVSESQSAQEEDDIRVKSATFFLTDFQALFINYIIGNGVGHQASLYGLKVWYYKDVHGFYQSDLGIIGSYSMYGILSVIGVILTLRKIFIIKVHPNYHYIKFWSVTIVFSSILGWPFFRPDNIIAILSALYLLDVSNYELRIEQHELIKGEESHEY